jgi:hypothetical protein
MLIAQVAGRLPTVRLVGMTLADVASFQAPFHGNPVREQSFLKKPTYENQVDTNWRPYRGDGLRANEDGHEF